MVVKVASGWPTAWFWARATASARAKFPNLDLVLIESGGDILTAMFSPVRTGQGIDEIVRFVVEKGGLGAS